MSPDKIMPIDIWTSLNYPKWKDNFEWPINVHNLFQYRIDIEKMLFIILKEEKSFEIKQALKIGFHWMVLQYLSLLESLITIQGLKEKNFTVTAENQHPFWSITKGLIYNGLPNNYIFQPTRFKNNIKTNIKLIARNLIINKNYLFNTNVTSLFPNKFLINYAHSEKYFIKTNNLSRWFPYKIPSNYYKTNLCNISEKVKNAVLKIYLQHSVKNINSEINNFIYSFTKDLLNEIIGNYLWIKSNRKLPSKLLSGTGNNYYLRLLGSIMREEEKDVICTEHADPNAIYNFTYQGYAEFGICNKYLVYTEKCVDSYSNFWENTTKIQDNMPEMIVDSLKNSDYSSIYNKYKAKSIQCKSKDVLYIAAGFRNDFTHLETRFPDMVYLDWQNYLFKVLSDLGYNVLCKLHPGTILRNRSFPSFKNVSVISGFFEEYLERDNILIFDHPMSTAFSKAVCTNKPIVLISNNKFEFDANALDDLSQRCEILEGYHDHRNRFRVNKDYLEKALLGSLKNKNHEFVKNYFLKNEEFA